MVPRLPRTLTSSLVVLSILVAVFTPASAQPSTPPVLEDPRPAARVDEHAQHGSTARVNHPKMDSQIAAVAKSARERGSGPALQSAAAGGLSVREGRVRVVVEANDVGAARVLIEQVRGTVEREAPPLLQALLPADALEVVANHPSVRYVRPPLRPVPSALVGEGPNAAGATAWQAAGLNGSGVKVAILDLGFLNYTARQATGDLPPNVVAQDFCEPGGFNASAHGTAVAEVVNEMAPGAQLYLVCADTEVGLVNAKDWIKAQNIPIINHSVSWFLAGRGDGSGEPSTPNGVVADARASGILWVNAAGNSGQRHWSGTFSDPDGNGFQNFAPTDEGNTVVLGAGREACFVLEWDNWPTTAQDFDLLLYRPTDLASNPNAAPVAVSENAQTGSQRPVEYICYTNPGPTQSFAVFVLRVSATQTPRFDLWSLDANLEYQTPGNVELPASSPHVLAVGAACWQSSQLEPYSSVGPTIDGRIKPDLVAPDAVSSATYGGSAGCSSGFAGTSAASPHVAGAAALVKQANPGFDVVQLQAFLTSRAIDIAIPGIDNQTGAGRLQLGSPPSGGGGSTVSGRGFSVQTNPTGPVVGHWTDGSVETGYLGVGITLPSGAVTPFPSNSTLLPANATSFADTTPVPGVRCYTVLVLGGNPPGSINDGNGDLICAWRGLANGVAPADFTARLDQGQNATLSWAPGSTPNGAILFVASGGGTLQIAVGPGQNSIPHNTGGAFTCYILLVSSGITDALCPFPGASTLVGGTAAGASVVDGATRLREQLLGR